MFSPRRYLENLLMRMKLAHEMDHPAESFQRPGLPSLAKLLAEAGYSTPKGHPHWWPAQVQQLLEGRFDHYYSTPAGQP